MASFLLKQCHGFSCKARYQHQRRSLRLLCALSLERSGDPVSRKNKPSAPAAAALSVVERDMIVSEEVQNAYEAGYQVIYNTQPHGIAVLDSSFTNRGPGLGGASSYWAAIIRCNFSPFAWITLRLALQQPIKHKAAKQTRCDHSTIRC
ncbi:hypothetical protein Vafri_15097 [Volvox africanus]|nr:hypothetical protein Vafri_15097 [Volvox africanus]